jgi:hypothetical protein
VLLSGSKRDRIWEPPYSVGGKENEERTSPLN